MKKLFAVLSVITIQLSILGQDTETKTLDKDAYTIEYPSNWTLDESGQMGTSFFLFSGVSSDQDQFKENVNLMIQDLSAYNLDLDQYTEISEKQIDQLITDGKLLSSERKKAKGKEFHKVVYTGKQGMFDLTFMQYYWLEENKAYILTLTCEQKAFEDYKVIG